MITTPPRLDVFFRLALFSLCSFLLISSLFVRSQIPRFLFFYRFIWTWPGGGRTRWRRRWQRSCWRPPWGWRRSCWLPRPGATLRLGPAPTGTSPAITAGQSTLPERAATEDRIHAGKHTPPKCSQFHSLSLRRSHDFMYLKSVNR